MRNVLIVLVILGALVAWQGPPYVTGQLQQKLVTQLDAIEVRSGPTGGQAVATLRVRNDTPFRGEFVSLKGRVSIDDREVDWRFDGLQPGDQLQPGEETRFLVVIPIGVNDVILAGLGALMKGGLTVRFDGTLNVLGLGMLPVEVPIKDEQRLQVR
jgi:hypothetical protein